MAVHFTFRKIEATAALKDRIERRVEKLHKFVTYPMDTHVTVSLERTLHCAEIVCHAEHQDFVATAKTKDLYESIDLVAHKLEAQLKKGREKRKTKTAAHLVTRPRSLKLASDIGAEVPHREKKTRKAV